MDIRQGGAINLSYQQLTDDRAAACFGKGLNFDFAPKFITTLEITEAVVKGLKDVRNSEDVDLACIKITEILSK